MIISVHVPDTIIKMRLDKALGILCPDLSRSRLKVLIQEGYIKSPTLALTDPAQKISGPLDLTITVPEAATPDPLPENIPLDIIYEDTDLLVLNKQAGLVVHPACGHLESTLVNALLYHCGSSLSGIGGVKRPGIVHRLDKETSGLMVVAKNDYAHHKLSLQFADRSLSRTYTAYVWGVIHPQGTLEGYIGRSKTNRKKMALYFDSGKPAITHYHRQRVFGTLASKVICHLETGRTHQIRVHLSSVGHGIINDPLYGSPKRGLNPEVRQEIREFSSSPHRQALHAHAIRFTHPVSEKEMSFSVDLPSDLQDLEKLLEKHTHFSLKKH